MTTSELAHGSINSKRVKANKSSSSDSNSSGSSQSGQRKKKAKNQTKNGTKNVKNKQSGAQKPQRKLLVSFDFLGGGNPGQDEEADGDLIQISPPKEQPVV